MFRVSPGLISVHLFISWCIYFKIILLVRGNAFSCAWVVVYDDVLVVLGYCEGRYVMNLSVMSSSFEIIVGVVVGRDVLVASLCIGFL